MRINPIQPTTPFRGKVNTGTLIILGLFVGSFAGAYFVNKKGKEK